MGKPLYRVYYDFEFHEQGVLDVPLDVISVGMVGEDSVPGDDRELYLQNVQAHWGEIEKNPWLVANVLPHLREFNLKTMRPKGLLDGPVPFTMPWVTRKNMARLISEFLQRIKPEGHHLQLRAHFADYDHTALAGLFGKMIELPRDLIPMWSYDLKQRAWELRDEDDKEPRLPENSKTNEHDALADARWNRDYDRLLDEVAVTRGWY